ncbi:hypothetical protein H5410_004071, partial [Solanum commersonii]
NCESGGIQSQIYSNIPLFTTDGGGHRAKIASSETGQQNPTNGHQSSFQQRSSRLLHLQLVNPYQETRMIAGMRVLKIAELRVLSVRVVWHRGFKAHFVLSACCLIAHFIREFPMNKQHNGADRAQTSSAD